MELICPKCKKGKLIDDSIEKFPSSIAMLGNLFFMVGILLATLDAGFNHFCCFHCRNRVILWEKEPNKKSAFPAGTSKSCLKMAEEIQETDHKTNIPA